MSPSFYDASSPATDSSATAQTKYERFLPGCQSNMWREIPLFLFEHIAHVVTLLSRHNGDF
ncbi:hypothetical protein [Yersinia enterocolitica]|uniref:hypothetical protein n=1 Tax=Yersinia enterocolitica TaxID=630 RepID=UPI00155B1534|nr:hypothetical protein [Yersinia enterocolitica]NQS96524.1 hypothetical protein [Yersinia enterocolitica]UXD24624.1 hypothetical protein FORC065_1775 [Yersinia enterocolitica]HDL6873235.1 hypothetical protein [Yersinia enterocolitica]HDL6889798.1 hypothetical protein [Yersinia enterocolitica]HDL7084363.1 hypothetical protein [Yersinia enterocolitica]